MTDAGTPSTRARVTWTYRDWFAFAIIVIAALIIVPIVAIEAYEYPRRAVCANLMQQIGVSMKIYWHVSRRDELYPPISDQPGRLAMDRNAAPQLKKGMDEISKQSKPDEYLQKLGWSPERVWENIFDDTDYFYLGYAMADEKDLEIFARYYRQSIETGLPMHEDIDDPDSPLSGSKLLYRLRQGVERVFWGRFNLGTGDFGYVVQARMPILIERVDNHSPRGGNVLYFDGHVEFIEYPGKWPMTEKTIRILNELDALGSNNAPSTKPADSAR